MSGKLKLFKKVFFILSLVIVIASLFIIPQMLYAADEATTTTSEIKPEVKFDITYPELKAKAGAQFEFKADVSFIGEEETVFNLTAEAPQGWYVSIQPAYEQTEISAVKLIPGKKESLKFVAIPLTKQEPGEYDIKIKAASDTIQAEAEFKAIITATYELTFTPTNGRYDMKATSGKDNHFAVQLKNTGSAAIEKITLTSSGPDGWKIKFNPSEIDKLDADKTKDIDVTVFPPDRTIAGDYMVTLNVASENSSPKMDVRVTVQTPTIWGWVGIGIIVIVIVGVGIIFAKLGRR
ncbi:MAG: NEW3 domain-containing protein [Actinobacteria bacterium]|nr:NEW3 domain-containing protein [Actinomycetota bacterium]